MTVISPPAQAGCKITTSTSHRSRILSHPSRALLTLKWSPRTWHFRDFGAGPTKPETVAPELGPGADEPER